MKSRGRRQYENVLTACVYKSVSVKLVRWVPQLYCTVDCSCAKTTATRRRYSKESNQLISRYCNRIAGFCRPVCQASSVTTSSSFPLIVVGPCRQETLRLSLLWITEVERSLQSLSSHVNCTIDWGNNLSVMHKSHTHYGSENKITLSLKFQILLLSLCMVWVLGLQLWGLNILREEPNVGRKMLQVLRGLTGFQLPTLLPAKLACGGYIGCRKCFPATMVVASCSAMWGISRFIYVFK